MGRSICHESSVPTVVAAANAALMVLLVSVECGSSVLLASAKAMRQSEQELDALVDTGKVQGLQKGYETVAQRRSAAEFLRDHLTGNVCKVAASAMQEFDMSVGELDETISGYRREGYDLSCPKLNCGFVLCVVPYKHWWIFAGSHGSGELLG